MKKHWFLEENEIWVNRICFADIGLENVGVAAKRVVGLTSRSGLKGVQKRRCLYTRAKLISFVGVESKRCRQYGTSLIHAPESHRANSVCRIYIYIKFIYIYIYIYIRDIYICVYTYIYIYIDVSEFKNMYMYIWNKVMIHIYIYIYI